MILYPVNQYDYNANSDHHDLEFTQLIGMYSSKIDADGAAFYLNSKAVSKYLDAQFIVEEGVVLNTVCGTICTDDERELNKLTYGN